MKRTWSLVVLLSVVVGSSAWADFSLLAEPWMMTPRQLGMGGAAIGVADDAGAWVQNPAGLAALNVPVPEGKSWGHDAVLLQGLPSSEMSPPWAEDYNILAGSWSGWRPADSFGIGGGLGRWAEVYNYGGLGVGTQLRRTKLLVGANFVHYNTEFISSNVGETVYNVGLMYPLSDSFKLGLRVQDVTQIGESKRLYDAGFGWRPCRHLLVALDALDASNVTDDGPYFSGGAELLVGQDLAVRAGLLDDGSTTNLTAGLGLRISNSWRIDAAYADFDGATYWALGGGLSF